MKTLVRTVLLLWTAFLLMHGYYLLLAVWSVPHPSYIPLAGFVAVQLVTLLAILGLGAWFVIFGKGIRLKAFSWTLLGILPAFIWYSQASLSFQYMKDRGSQAVEPTWYLCNTESIACALVDGIGRFTLPYKLEGKKIVMFYDAQIQDPVGDVAKMDAFIQSEEKAIGMEIPNKIHWFRCSAFGMSGFAMNGITVADPTCIHSYEGAPVKDKPGALHYVDFHEVAHNLLPLPTALDFVRKKCPPGFLIEGWAEARTVPYQYYINECRNLKIHETALLFRVLASPKYYFQIENRVYVQGGAFVHFLINTYGMEKFCELYTDCTMPTFLGDFERVYGLSLDQVEKLFWNDIQKSFSFAKATETLSEDEKELLQRFRESYERQEQVYDEFIFQGTVRANETRYTQHENGTENVTGKSALRMKDGKYFRYDAEVDLVGTVNTSSKRNESSSKMTTVSVLLPKAMYVDRKSTKPETFENYPYIARIDPSEWIQSKKDFAESYISDFKPLYLFDRAGYQGFQNPEYYFWNPSAGTTVRSVIKGDDGVVQIDCGIVHPEAKIARNLLLELDSERHWVLLKAEYQHLIDDVLVRTQTDSRDYEGSFHDIPLLKKLRSTSESFGEYPSKWEKTFELVHHDTKPVPEKEFYRDVNFEIPEQPFQWNAKKMLQRDLAIIAGWLFIACVVIFITRKNREF